MSKESGDPDHIPLATLWSHSRNAARLDDSQLQHLQSCDNCIEAMGACHGARSLEHAQTLLGDRSPGNETSPEAEDR
jgi:hypothetical protein